MTENDGVRIWNAVFQASDQAQTLFQEVEAFCPTFDAGRRIASVQAVLERLKRPFKFGVLGEFNAGKSSLINILADRDVALTDEMEVTAVLSRYHYAETEEAVICFNSDAEQRLSINEANELLSARRHDVSWLQQIKEVSFGAPCENLKRTELWDSPGLTGSSFNEHLAGRFVEEVDAAIWVFDANYIGGSRIAGVIDGLRDRGKHVIVVINKCEEWTENELGGIETTVKRTYPSLQASGVVLFSAWIARAHQQGELKDFYGDLPADGGLGHLNARLETEILQDPKRLTAMAAAGDLRAIIYSSEDWLHRERAQADRIIWLLQRQENEVQNRVGPRLQRLASELTDELEVMLRDHLLDQMRKHLDEAKLAELQDDHWVERKCGATLTIDEVQKVCDDFAETQSGRIAAVLAQLGLDQRAYTFDLLTPQERVRLISGETHEVAGEIVARPREGPLAEIDPKSAAIGAAALVGIAALATFPVPTAIFLTGLAIGKFFNANKRRALTPQQWLSVRLNECYGVFEKEIGRLKSYAGAWLASEMQKIEIAATEMILNDQRRQLLKDSGVEAMHRLRANLDQVAKRLSEIGLYLEHEADLTEKPKLEGGRLLLGPGDAELRRRLLERIFAEARTRFSITDGELDHDALKLLLDLPEETPIRILTWQQTLSIGLSDLFAAEVEKLRGLRNGGEVTVATIQQQKEASSDQSIVQAAGDSRPTGCWIFTDSGAYRFSHSLGNLLATNEGIDFTSQDQQQAAYEEHFLRWWENRMTGYQTVYML